MSKVMKVRIWGQDYAIKSDLEEDYVLEVASYVNRKIEEVLRTNKTVAVLKVAILACLNIANDYFQTRKEKEEFEGKVESYATNLIKVIDSNIPCFVGDDK